MAVTTLPRPEPAPVPPILSVGQVLLVAASNPLVPADGRRVLRPHLGPNDTVLDLLQREAPGEAAPPSICLVNGRRVHREDWGTHRLHDGDAVVIQAAAAGGDSDVGRAILMIAVVVAAFYTGGAVAGAGYSNLAVGAAQTVVLVGGQYLVDSVRPPRSPDISKGQGAQGSPTYNIGPARNRARPYEPMPLLYGHHKLVPDTAAAPYTEYEGEDQYLFQIFNFGVWEGDVSEFALVDTPIEEFGEEGRDWDLEISGEDGRLHRFPGVVTTTEGADLTESAGWITRNTAANTEVIGVDIVGQLYRVTKEGKVRSLGVDLEGQYRRVGDTEWIGLFDDGQMVERDWYWSKGFWTTIPRDRGADQSQWNQIAYDDSLDPDRYTEGEKVGTYVVTRPASQKGTPPIEQEYDVIWRQASYLEHQWQYPRTGTTGSFNDSRPPRQYELPSDTLNLENDSTEPIRNTRKVRVDPGQYEVRIRRVTPEHTHNREFSNITWESLKSYRDDDGDYSGQLRVGVKIRATGQLSGVIDNLSAIGHARIPVPGSDDENADDWAVDFTANPAWQWLDMAIGKADAQGNAIYGARIDPRRINLEEIVDWAQFCFDNGLECHAVFDGGESCAQIMDVIESCGRATRTWGSGLLGVSIDRPEPAANFYGMSSIRAGSFQVRYLTQRMPDMIEANFINSEQGWEPDVVRAAVPGHTSAERPARIELKGVTQLQQATEEVNLEAARQALHRRRISWETDQQGFVNRRGDVVTLSHDLTRWSESGRVVAGTTTELTLSRPVTFIGEGEEHWILLVSPAGEMSHHQVEAQPIGTSDQVTLLDPLDTAPDDDAQDQPLDWQFCFGPEPTPGRPVRIIEIRPMHMDRVRITAIDELEAYHASVDGPVDFPGTGQGLPDAVIGEVETSELLLDVDGNTEVTATWQMVYGELTRVSVSINGRPWQSRGTTDHRRYTERVDTGDTITFRLKPMRRQLGSEVPAGTPVQITHNALGAEAHPAPVENFSARTTNWLDDGAPVYGIRLEWQSNEEADLRGYEIRSVDAHWGEDGEDLVARTPNTRLDLPIGRAGQYPFYIRAYDHGGRYSEASASETVVIEGPPAVTHLSADTTNQLDGQAESYGIRMRWGAGRGTFPVARFEVRTEDNNWGVDTPSLLDVVSGNRASLPLTTAGTYQLWVAPIDYADNVGPAVMTDLVITPPGQPTLDERFEGADFVLRWAAVAQGSWPIDAYDIRRAWPAQTGTLQADGTDNEFRADQTADHPIDLSEFEEGDTLIVSGFVAQAGNNGSWTVSAVTISSGVHVVSIEGSLLDESRDDITVEHEQTFAAAERIDTIDARKLRYAADWLGTRLWYAAARDVVGNLGPAGSIDAQIVAPPAPPNFSSKVISGDVLLNWDRQRGTLPIVEYQVWRDSNPDANWGAASNARVTEQEGTFASIKEDEVNTRNTYFSVPVDSAGNVGAASALTAFVDEPLDFIIQREFEPALSTGTSTNLAVSSAGALLGPFDVTETWEDHFVGTGTTASPQWPTPQDLIDAGYTYYLQPGTPAQGSWVSEVLDVGAVLGNTRITVNRQSQVLAGSPAVTTTIEWRESASEPWESREADQAFVANVGQVRITLTVDGPSDFDLIQISQVSVSLTVQKVTTEGVYTVPASDGPGPTIITLERAFLDIRAVSASIKGNHPGLSVYWDVDETPGEPTDEVQLWVLDGSGNWPATDIDVGITVRGIPASAEA